MKKPRFTKTQIVSILKEADAGINVEELYRKHGISSARNYNWKKKYSRMDASEIKRLKGLEEEKVKPKRIYADIALEHTALKDLIVKKGWWQQRSALRLRNCLKPAFR